MRLLRHPKYGYTCTKLESSTLPEDDSGAPTDDHWPKGVDDATPRPSQGSRDHQSPSHDETAKEGEFLQSSREDLESVEAEAD